MANQRTHLYAPISGKDQASILNWASVRVYENDGMTPYKGKIYRGNIGALTFPNPFVVAPALVDIWFDEPVRVVLGVTNNFSQVEQLTPAFDASQDADQAVYTPTALNVTGGMVANGLLRAAATDTASWFQPGLSPHDHHGMAPNTTRLNIPDGATSRIASYPGTTAIGYGPASTYADPSFFFTFGQLSLQGTWASLSGQQWQRWSGSRVLNTPADMRFACMCGYGAYSTSTAAISFGFEAHASRGNPPANVQGSIAIGSRARSSSGALAIGHRATMPPDVPAGFTGARNLIALGNNARGYGENAVSVGAFSYATQNGFSVGFNSGGVSRVNPGSVSLGANAVLPAGSNDSSAPVLLLGTPAATEHIPMITGPLCYVPENLSVAIPGSLNVSGSAVIGGVRSKVGFFGVTPVFRPMVGEIEPGTGIEALDNLIVALRKIGLLVGPNEPVMRYDAEELGGFFMDQALVTSWLEANSDRYLAPQGADIVLPDPPPPPMPPAFTTPPDSGTEQDDSDIWNTEDDFIMIAPAATDDYIVVPANGKTQLFLCPAFYRRVTAMTIDFIAATPASGDLGQYLGHRDNFTFLPDRPGPVPIPAGTVAVSIRYNASHRFTVWCV